MAAWLWFLLAAWAQDATEPAPEGPDDPRAVSEDPAPALPLAAKGEGSEPELSRAPTPLRDRLEAQELRLDEQQAEIERLAQQLTETRLEQVPPDRFRFQMEGYYRARAYVFSNLFAEAKGHRDARYLEHKLRLRPVFSYRDVAKLKLQVNGLEDVVWGDNASLAPSAVFAGDPSVTGPEGRTVPSFYLSRAWMEFNLPVGLLRVGRQPSHWGMGLLANDGDGFRNSFGEARYGNTFDRVIFATRPIAIAQGIMGQEDSDIPLFLAVGVDRLVEDPLIRYYGFKCPDGIYSDEEGYTADCDPDGDGRTNGHDYTDDSFEEGNRGQDWWADQDDDVMEMIYALIYRGEDRALLGTTGDLTAGAYVIHRIQRETDSQVIVADLYLDGDVHGVKLELEALTIQGTTRGIALPGAVGLEEGGDPLLKRANIWSYVGRAGYGRGSWQLLWESGYASGDANVADQEFTSRSIHPDHNVGLLLYEEILARASAQAWGDGGRALWTNGGVSGSHYIFPTARLYPLENWELIGGFLMAWPDRPNGSVVQCREGESCQQATATSAALGWEADFAIHHSFHKYLRFALELGYAHATDRIALRSSGLNPKGNFFTLQSRIAWQF